MEIRFLKFLSDGTDQELADCLAHLAPEPGSVYLLTGGWFKEGKTHTATVSSIEDGHVVIFSKRAQKFYRIALGDWWKQAGYNNNIIFVQGPNVDNRPRFRRFYPEVKRRLGT